MATLPAIKREEIFGDECAAERCPYERAEGSDYCSSHAASGECEMPDRDDSGDDDGPKFCPDCERPQQFATLCASCLADRRAEREDCDYGGAFDGFTVTSDADGEL